MRQIEGIIFDMDGVIVDSEPRHQQAFNAVFEAMGYADTHGMVFEDYLGRSDKILWEDFIAKHQPQQTLQELLAWRQERFIEIIQQEQPLFKGIPKLIRSLATQYPLAVASGSLHPVIDAVLALQDLRPYFSAVVSSCDVPHGKPNPDIFLKAAAEIETSPEKTCVIEDSEAGVEAGVRAGMHVVAITNSLPREQLAAAHKIVDSYDEFRCYLQELQLPASV
ncbi:MAG: Fructose-1-phosphate phosphatase YqaB [Verrucomicrobia subdivision 3 bacterium]|nr:Fructose-1-phosphate phosphatase YqaB [Limisphaerales bacterium]MCS1413050.1 Fructose-1-phosphate phosphatase YqaB [Limisphaerales bacterium]